MFSHFCEGSPTDASFAEFIAIVVEGGELYILVPLLPTWLIDVFLMDDVFYRTLA